MTESLFDHDRLDVCRLSIEYVASAFDTSCSLAGLHRHARGSALEYAAIQDVHAVSGVSESVSEYTPGDDYEHEHRNSEHEHEEMPELNDAPERSNGVSWGGGSFVRVP